MINWQQADAVALREYLASPSGQNLLNTMNEARPKPIGTTIEQVALNSKTAEGWDMLKERILQAAQWQGEKSNSAGFVNVDPFASEKK